MNFLKNLKFGFDEVDVTLNGLEMIGALLLGAGICAAPFVIKWILVMLLGGV